MSKKEPKNGGGPSLGHGGSNPGFVSVAECRDRHLKIDLALFSGDGRGGIVKDIADIKAYMAQQSEGSKEKKEEYKLWKAFAFSIVGGLIVWVLNYVVRR